MGLNKECWKTGVPGSEPHRCTRIRGLNGACALTLQKGVSFLGFQNTASLGVLNLLRSLSCDRDQVPKPETSSAIPPPTTSEKIAALESANGRRKHGRANSISSAAAHKRLRYTRSHKTGCYPWRLGVPIMHSLRDQTPLLCESW